MPTGQLCPFLRLIYFLNKTTKRRHQNFPIEDTYILLTSFEDTLSISQESNRKRLLGVALLLPALIKEPISLHKFPNTLFFGNYS